MTRTGYRFETRRPSVLDAFEIEAWDSALDLSATCDSAFFSYAFAKASEGAGFDVRVTLALDEAGAPVGFFAFQKNSGIAGILGLGGRVGGGMADYSGPLLAPEAEDGPSLDDFLNASGLKFLEISHAPARAAGPGEDLVADEGGPVTRMPDGFDAWWEGFSLEKKSRASDLGRRRRKIEREFGPLRLVLEAEKTGGLLDEIIDEKCRQYRSRGARDVFESGQNRKLLHCLAALDDPRCTLVLSTLHAGETWAASHIGLRCGSVLHYWFPVFNDDLKRMSPGRLLILEMLRGMPQSGLDLLDYGLGESRTKLEFANATRPFVKGTWRAAGPRGALAKSYQSLMWRLR